MEEREATWILTKAEYQCEYLCELESEETDLNQDERFREVVLNAANALIPRSKGKKKESSAMVDRGVQQSH